MIIYTPIDLPKIEPDNWDTFWDIWNRYSGNLTKAVSNGKHSGFVVGGSGVWQGLDIIKKSGVTAWEAPFYDIKNELPKLHTSLINLPIPNLWRVRIISSMIPVSAHSDDNLDKWSLRGLLHYPAKKSQWYFVEPGNITGPRTYITLPEDTMWFAYNDKYCWHGTDYDPKNRKILVQLYYSGKIDELLKNSIEKYKDNTEAYE